MRREAQLRWRVGIEGGQDQGELTLGLVGSEAIDLEYASFPSSSVRRVRRRFCDGDGGRLTRRNWADAARSNRTPVSAICDRSARAPLATPLHRPRADRRLEITHASPAHRARGRSARRHPAAAVHGVRAIRRPISRRLRAAPSVDRRRKRHSRPRRSARRLLGRGNRGRDRGAQARCRPTSRASTRTASRPTSASISASCSASSTGGCSSRRRSRTGAESNALRVGARRRRAQSDDDGERSRAGSHASDHQPSSRQRPAFLAAARTNVINPPRLFAERGAAIMRGAHDMLGHDLDLAFASEPNAALRDSLRRAADVAIPQIAAYVAYLEKTSFRRRPATSRSARRTSLGAISPRS